MCIFTRFAYCVDIGSDTAPNRFNAIQVLNDGDRIAGFAAIDGGFKLFNSATTGTWDSFFAASGQISLREGTLVLNKDLVVSSVADIQTFGNIIGNNHVINFRGGGEILPSRATNCTIEQVTFISFGGIGNISSDWFSDGGYVAFAIFSGGFSGVAVLSFDGATFTLETFILNLDGGSSSQTNSVRCHPTLPFCAVVRSQSTGDELFSVFFAAGGPTLIVLDSDGIATGDYVACAWHPSGEYLAVGGTEIGAQLKVYPFDTGTGLFGAPSTFAITPSRSVQRESMAWNADGTLLAVGVNHTGANPDLLVYEFDASLVTLSLNASAVVDTGADVLSVSWNPIQKDFLAIGIEGGFTNSVFLFEHDFNAGTLTEQGDGISDLDSTAVQTVEFSPDGNCLGLGRDIFGGVGVVRSYAFDNPIFNQTFSIDSATAIASFRYSPSGQYQVTSQEGGTVIVAAFERLASVAMPQSTLANVELLFENDVMLQNCSLLLNGNNVINGRSGRVTLDSSCELIVDANSGLVLKDVTLRGINTNSLKLVDDTSKVVFDNVRIILDGEYSFTLGSFDVNNQLSIEGDGYTFNFQTDLVCTITRNSQLILNDGITFNYDPSIVSKTLLQLYDETSTLVLNGARLSANSAGIQLTKGRLFIEGKSFLNGAGMLLNEAIDFGDGNNVLNNLRVEWLPAAQLIVEEGFLRDRNV